MKDLSDIVVLFVDDETETIGALTRFLRREPYRKAFACSGEAALELMSGGNVDIVVSDVRMPNMSGKELIRIVKTRFPETICLLTSGDNEIDQIVKSVGIDNIFGFITKPIDADIFKRTINSAIDYYYKNSDR
jgi:DNA-binding NtrC family response regulator